MATFNRTAGDIDTIVAYLYGATGTVGATQAHVWTASIAKANLTASTVAGTDPNGVACLVCTVTLGTWLTSQTTAGSWFLEYQITFADGTEITWPGKDPDQIVVRAQAS